MIIRLVKNDDGSWRSWDHRVDDCMDSRETMEVVPVSDKKKGAELRTDISRAAIRYVRENERLQDAKKAFRSASDDLRKLVGHNAQFVVKIGYHFHLVATDGQGNIKVNKVEHV